MLRDSFWWPGDAKRGLVLAVILLMVVLHQSEVVGLLDSNALVFGWLPVQLAYDAAFNLFGVVVLYAMYRLAPEPPADVIERGPETETTTTPTEQSTEVTTDGR